MTLLANGLPAEDELAARRRAVLEVASRVVAEEGPHAVSLRRVATEAGGSTQLVYTLFGGKAGLADALYAEGFARLAEAGRRALDAAPPPGSPDRIVAIGRAYLAFSRAEPGFFAVMFGRAIPGFTPTRSTRGTCRGTTFGRLVAEVQACLDAGTLVASRRSEPTQEARDGGAETADGAHDLARLCWVTVHGLAALDAAGMLAPDDPEGFVEDVLRTPLVAHQP
jgi:AcrR family transcriptional regulator